MLAHFLQEIPPPVNRQEAPQRWELRSVCPLLCSFLCFTIFLINTRMTELGGYCQKAKVTTFIPTWAFYFVCFFVFNQLCFLEEYPSPSEGHHGQEQYGST